jgi:CRP/FNR family transcriptional regulator, cyclic AMP receptor protein
MQPRNKAWFFSQNPLTKNLRSDELDRLENITETVNLRKKQVIWSPTDKADRIFFIRSGLVKLSKTTDDGRELTLHLLQKNDILGEEALMGLQPHNSMAEAYEEVVLYSVSRDEFIKFVRGNVAMAMAIAEVMSDRRRSIENRLESLIFRTAHARLANLFLDLAERFGVRDSRGIIINMKLTHKEMASLIGASRETVSFAILDLRRDALILTEEKRVILLDPDALKRLAAT